MAEIVQLIVKHWVTVSGWFVAFLTGLYLLVKWAIEKGVEHYLDKAKKRYEADLEDISFAYRTQFSALHQKRAEVIAELYRMIIEREGLLRAQTTLREITKDSDDPVSRETRQELCDEAITKSIEISDFVRLNKIYFPFTLAETLERLQTAFSQAVVLQGIHIERINVGNVEERISVSAENYFKALTAIEDEFRSMLGVQRG